VASGAQEDSPGSTLTDLPIWCAWDAWDAWGCWLESIPGSLPGVPWGVAGEEALQTDTEQGTRGQGQGQGLRLAQIEGLRSGAFSPPGLENGMNGMGESRGCALGMGEGGERRGGGRKRQGLGTRKGEGGPAPGDCAGGAPILPFLCPRRPPALAYP